VHFTPMDGFAQGAWDTGRVAAQRGPTGDQAEPLGVDTSGLFAAIQAEEVSEAPPTANRGALKQVSCLVDWCGHTYHDLPLTRVLSLFSSPTGDGDALEWSPCVGGRGYKRGFVRGAVRVLYDGGEGMGVHVEISGDGCRQLEAEGVVLDWEVSLLAWRLKGARYSRLDLAIDDRVGVLDLAPIRAAVMSWDLVSRWRQADLHLNIRRTKGGVHQAGDGVTFGNALSKARLCIYDKSLEQKTEGHWVRVELRLRDERADAMVEALGTIGFAAVPMVLRGYLEFKVADTATRRTNWQPAEWWSAFLGEVEKLSLGVAPALRTVEKLDRWLRGQVSPGLAVWAFVKTAQGAHAPDLIAELVEQGAERWRSWHRSMLAGATPALEGAGG
jgi:phage replication initiation protein